MEKIQGKVGQRFLLKMLEDDSIGEMEFIEPTQSQHSGTPFYAKWWDGDLAFNSHSVDADRIVERTPENLKRAGKQTFATTPKES